MEELILIKLGGSVITDVHKPRTPKLEEISRLLEEIKSGMKSKKIILGHGGGSFPHVPAREYKVNDGIISEHSRIGASLTQRYAADLNAIMINKMLDNGIPAFPFSASSGAIAKERKIVSWNLENVRLALKNGFMPVTYGDVAMDSKQGVCIVSTEEIFRYMATELKPERIIIGSDVDGVFTSDPKIDPEAKHLRVISSETIRFINASSGLSRKYNVTGGMKSKIEFLYSIAKENGSLCQIVNATIPGRLQDSIEGREVLSTEIRA